jgi:hypothetical protein
MTQGGHELGRARAATLVREPEGQRVATGLSPSRGVVAQAPHPVDLGVTLPGQPGPGISSPVARRQASTLVGRTASSQPLASAATQRPRPNLLGTSVLTARGQRLFAEDGFETKVCS